MRSLSSLFLIGCVAAASLNTQYHGWKSNQEYRYKYSTQVLTGIPELNEQYSGVRLTAEVRVQPRQDSTCRVQLENPRFVSYNDVLEMRKNRIITPGQEQEIPSSFKTWLQTPFTVFHKRGLVEKIQTENGEPEFIVNVKKALISQLQNDLSQSERRDVHDQNQVQTGAQSDSMPVFTNQESSILGKCETVYTVSKLPEYLVREFEQSETDERINRQASKICEGKDYFEIIKTKNLDKCTERPVYHKTLGFWANTDGAGSESLPSHSSVTRTIICGSLHEYTIRKVTTENDILISTSGRFMRKEKVDISSFSTLELESVERMEREISEPSSPKGYPSLVFEYPSGIPSSSKSLKQEVSQQQQQQNQGQQQGQGQQQIQAPHPDMTSAPKFFSLRTENPEEIKQKVVEVFAQIVESTEKMTESSKKEKDVASLTVVASRTLSMLSYDELREVEQAIKSHYGDRYESLIQKAFFDLISISATNPCMKLIKDKVVSGEIKQDTASWAWILSNSLRSVKTPTEELLGELVELLKHENIQSNKVIRAAYAMGLTELIHKGCVNPESMKNEFPYKIYGQMCHREMSVIKDNLVPYLAKKLQESSKTDMGSVIVYINALGNLGTEESSEEILKVVEGRTSSNPHPRSVAVYMLIRPALEKPSIYRPVFMSLIENSAENPEVRMAAITALTYCSPSTADLQKIAIRSWFEPSTQVSTYIYSTLKTLSKLDGSFPEYESIKMKAQSTLRLAKPSTEGLQHSRNLQVVKFVESLKTAVSHKLQWTSSEESFFPKSIYFQAQTKGPVSDVDVLETTFYMQGAEFVLDKLYNMYSDLKGQNYKYNSYVEENMSEVEQKMRNINLEDSREDIKPEAHLTLKFLGLQKIFSIDEEYVRNIVRKISSDFMDNIDDLERGMNLEHLKILDLAGREMTMPTESGMPAILSVRNPTVAYNKAEIMVEREHSSGPKVEIRMKSVTNYKRQVQAGVVTAFTGKFHGAAVEVSMHIAIPQKIELTYINGQVLVSLKNSEEPEYQMEKPVLEFDVHPYTCAHLLSDKKPVAKGQNVKTIKSKHSEKQREFSIGKPFGLDAKIKVSTEESGIDLYKLWDELKINGPVFLAFWPNPITSSRRTTITLLYNPQASEVKELNFYLTVGMGKKDINSSVPQILFPTQNNEQKIEKICAKYATQQGSCQSQLKIKQQTPDDEIIQQCQQEKEQKQQHQQQQQQLFQQRHQQRQQVAQQNQPQQQERHQQIKQKQQQEQQQQPQLQQLHQYYLETELLLCQAERQLVKEEKNLCIEKLQQQGKSQQEAQKECIKVYELSKQQQKSKAALREVLQKLNSGRAMTISMKTVLRAREESENREIETQITVGDKMEMGAQRPEKTQVTMKLTLKTPVLRKPFDAEIHATGKIQRPNYLWEVEEILKAEISGKILIQGEFGLRGEKKERFGSTIVAVQSDKYLKYVRESEEKKECEIDQSKGRKLSEDCKKVRWQAASLDLVHAKLSLPRSITQNRFVELASEAVKVYYLPYLSQKSIEKKSHGDQEEYEVEARVAGHGETLSVKVSGNGDEVLLRDIRLGKSAKHLLPICTRFNLMTRVMQKLTSFNSPSSCVIESGKVETFDRMEYDYQLNNCEHIVFTESSPRPRITVSTRKTPEKQEVTMVVDGHKYEVEIKKDSRHSRDNMAVIKVNGEVKQWRSLEQQQEQQQQQQQQQLQQYMQNQQLQQILQSQQQQLQQQQQQQQQKQYYDSYHQNVYDDEDTYITNFKDGVYSIVSKKYGVSVIADGERMEVKSYQHVLRNRVAGLCGDLNGEITGDLKSSKRCMMPKHKLAALSFVLEDGKCGGIQEQEKSELRREESRCVRKEVVPTKVSQLFKNQLESKRKPELRHIVEVIKGETCISKELVRVCHSDFPKEISSRQVRFTCISGPKAEIYKRRAEYGDNVEELSRLPTQYVHLVHEPSRC